VLAPIRAVALLVSLCFSLLQDEPAALIFRVVSADGTPLDAVAFARQPPDNPERTRIPVQSGVFRFPVSPPAKVLLEIGARGHETLLLSPLLGRPTLGQATHGEIDLGDLVLGPGEVLDVTVRRADGRPLAGAAIHAVPDAFRFVPDHRTRLARTDPRGRASFNLSRNDTAFLVLAPGQPPTFVERAEDGWPRIVTLSAGKPLTLRIEADVDAVPVPGDTVQLAIDLDRCTLSFPAPLATDITVPLATDGEPPIRVRIDQRGFRGAQARVIVPADGSDEPVRMVLEPHPLKWARLKAFDANGGESLPIDTVLVGRARDDRPDRIDFVPDWACVVMLAQDRTSALVGGPAAEQDMIVRADGYQDVVMRGVPFEGTRTEPSSAHIELSPIVPLTGTTRAGHAIVQARSVSRDHDDVPRLWKLAGTVGLLASVRSDETGGYRFDLSTRDEVALTVDPPDGETFRVAGLVTGPVEGPPFTTTVYLMEDSDQTSPGERVFRARVQSQGSFAFTEIPAGTYRAYVDRDDRALFSGLYGTSAHAIVDRLHAPGRGQRLDVHANISDLELEFNHPTVFEP